ncbi:ABC1 kinase family protein [Sphingobacterium gobiense]|uniref:Ubiquinone biosynthesis protein n=1 Tax=Sphingobacterium gobiense TaxID=1382456 RepID=A0A2S9JSM7_9SPHI|nr:lipopolysaccharide core heptose(II) kinase RfaY [Sphingobacterium gobiense]PRD56292.1 ubiquinone biosynthesis protein [Sphingobacterium gobiense]
MYGIYKFKRIGYILQVLSKHGLEEVVSRSNIDRIIPDSFLLWNTHTRRIFEDNFNVRVRAAIEELGPTFIKLGQLLSNRADIVPRDLRQELVKLQDEVPTDIIDIKAKLQEAFDINVDEHFEHIDEIPIAAASIAQVYRAVLKDGTVVVLKVRRKGISDIVHADLDFIQDLVKLLRDKYEVIQKINLYEVVQSFANSLLNELSFTNELNSIERFRRNFNGNHTIYVPKTYRAYSNDEILCMEYVEGIKVNDISGLHSYGISPGTILQNCLDLYLEQILQHGFFHADPHPGNVFVNKQGQVVFIDFGSMGFMIPRDRDIIEAMVINFLMNDAKDLIRNVKKLAVVHHIEDERQLERDAFEIFQMIEENALDDIDIAVMFRKLNKILQYNSILLPDFVYVLLRGISLLEGTGRQLDAQLNIPQSIKPFATKIAKEKTSADYLKKQLLEKGKFIKEVLTEVPQDLITLLEKAKSDKLTLNHKIQDFDRMQLIFHRIGNKFLLSILAMTFGVGASILAHGRVGYILLGVPILSWLGFIASFVLSTILIIYLLRSK